MKRLGFFLGLAIVAALAAFVVTQRLERGHTPDELTWLRTEFSLTPAQAQAVGILHESFRPVCALHCQKIMTAQEYLENLKRNGKVNTPEYAAALAGWKALCDECMNATRHHLDQVAAQMSPDQARRYLELVGPKLTQHAPGSPFGLR